jgi:tRNA-dihydrouridine synthase
VSCETSGNNATPPSPAIAPGSPGRAAAGELDPRRVAEDLVARFGPGGMDPRVRALVPAFDAPFFQAGLAGYSDAAMRIIARRHGCPFCVTEALLDRTMLAGGRGFAKADLGELHDNVPGGTEDAPLACQIMGSDPREMAAAALKAVEQGRRGEKDYRALAYAGRDVDFARDVAGEHLRLPGGVQVGRVGEEAIGNGQWAMGPEAERLRPLPIADCPLPPSFAVLDVNLACPVKKISKKARGGHWLAEPAGAIAILEAVREAVPAEIPVTVKMRRSFDDTPEMIEHFFTIFDAAYDLGCAWVTVHGRTVEQKYLGPSRWDPIRELVERVNARWPDRAVFGSGDVWTVADIFRMVGYTGVAGASVARGCIGNPWIFRQARDLLAGREPAPPTLAEQRAVLLEHFDLALAVNQRFRQPETHTGRTMRKFAIRFAEHHPEAERVRRRFVQITSTEEWRGVVDEFYTP